ncbi:phage structural protein [Achromobacter aloeverae]
MASTPKTYDPGQVKLVVAAHSVSGYATDTFVNVEPIADGTQSVAGADGEVARSISRDERLRFTVTLLQTSASNDVLTALYQADKLSGGNGMFPIILTDLRGRTLHAVDSAWVTKLPPTGFGGTVGNREWVIETGSGDSFVGGNS